VILISVRHRNRYAAGMIRAILDRRRTLREWLRRHEEDAALRPGYFRKGRRAKGCNRVCAACRAMKGKPRRREFHTLLAVSEWLNDQ
jgi:hypothetical protein